MTDTLHPPTAPHSPLAPPIEAPKSLKRSIGVVGGTLLTLSCLTPASSLFVIVPPLFADLGTGTALTIVVAAVLCVAVAFCYSELGTLIPSAGGEYAMVGTLIGRLAGWIVFVLSLIVVMIVPPIIALGTGEYLAPIMQIDPKIAGAAVMLLATVMGLLDLRANAWITGIFLVLEVVAAAVVAFLGFSHSSRPASVLIHPVTEAGHGVSTAVTAGTIIAGLAIALFVLQGFSTAVYLSEEMENPRRTVSRTVLWTLGIGAVVVIVPTIAITLGAPDMNSLMAGDLSALVQGWSNSAVGTFISLCIALAIINAGIVMVIQNSRVLYASARDRAWPAPVNRAFGTLSKRFGAPWIATLAVGVPGAVLCFVPVETLSGVTGVAVAAMYIVVALAALGSRRGGHKERAAWRMPLWPAVPLLLVVVLAYVLTQQTATDLVITGVIVAASLAYWLCYLRPRQSTRWVISVPEEEMGLENV
ncbi:APC family permease [Actinacidiphila glaucinigra]|uniref:Amino acid/polyamine/organocation transporter, APC superfamily n=1 Tax=Actinacidiphila glaucinigra TaxID=235986 RepID=A0A239LD14_9ACTN|nr:APC family permease [Actinacidiphila glaucinigra]SNT27529.1 amino acid/polyamine/organocation transporter, APC superfamily [Actinacidiphila glaucinigra]